MPISIFIKIIGPLIEGEAEYVGDVTEREKELSLQLLEKLKEINKQEIIHQTVAIYDKPLKKQDRLKT